MADPQAEARIRDLEKRMAAMPGSRIFVGLAEEYRRAGRFGDALATLRTGLEAHPTYLSARIAVARLYHEMGRDDDAIEAFARVLATDRENLVAAKALGDLYARRGDAVEAVKKYKLYRALSGDRSMDDRVAKLEKEARPEVPPPAPPPSLPLPTAPPAPASEPRMFDPINFSDSSAEFRFDPKSTIALSTLEFSPAPTPPSELAAPPASGPLPSDSEPSVSPGELNTEVTLPGFVLPAELAGERETGSEVGDALPASAVSIAPALPEEEVLAPETEPTEEEPPTEAPPELPPSRTLAELYEKQGFREEARRIYERLSEEHPEDESLTRRIAAVRGEAAAAVPSDLGMRRRRTLEEWLARVKANSAPGPGTA